MARKSLFTAGVSAAVAIGVALAPAPAFADELTTLTATAKPEVVQPGEEVTVTLTVTNHHDRKITYEPIVASDEFSDCAEDIGTLTPGQEFSFSCSAVVEDDITATFSITNAESEHNETSAEATVDITLEPEVPVTTPPQDEPSLPITGSSVTPLLITGVGLLLVGLFFASRLLVRRG